MKIWIKSDGAKLVVREVSDPMVEMSLKDRKKPLPIINDIFDGEAARERLKSLIATGNYEYRNLKK